MINRTIHLQEYYPKLKNDVTLVSYVPAIPKEFTSKIQRKCVIVLPGGGYQYLSEREGEQLSLRFAAQDIASFTLWYSIGDQITYPYPVVDVLAAIAYVRAHAEEYHIDPEHIGLLGFSAGGHLAAATGAFCQEEEFYSTIGLTKEETRVQGVLLGYPVLVRSFGHEGTFSNISCGVEELKEKYSLEKRITENYPKTFIYHTAKDGLVPVQNATIFATELANHKVPFELHIFPDGEHGTSLCDSTVYDENTNKQYLEDISYNKEWMDLCIRFVKTKM